MLSKFLAFTCWDKSFKDIFDLTHPINKEYFQKHDIEYLNFNNEQDIHLGYYQKFFKVKSLMQERKDIDYFYMMDSDIVICDQSIDIRLFTKLSSKNILICSAGECYEDMFWNVNTGSIVFKRSDKTLNFLDLYISIARQNDFKINDQVVFQAMLRKKMIKDIDIFPSDSFNHGGKNYFLFHACKSSTTNQSFDQALKQKIKLIEEVIEGIKDGI